MHLRKLLGLSLAVAGLVAAVWWQAGREAREAAVAADRPLFEGLDPARLASIRVDNLERGLQLELERGESGGWQIVDPIDYPAAPEVTDLLTGVLRDARATPAPDAQAAKVSLDPPRVVLEIEERRAAGAPVRRRLEVGAVDLDGESVYVRTDGRIARTTRALDTALERDLQDWRSRAITSLERRSIVEVHRRGKAAPSGGGDDAADLGFDAIDDGGWRATSPQVVRLDPARMDVFLGMAGALRASGFFDDAPGPLANYGLDRPQLEIELVTSLQGTEHLRFAPSPNGGDWLCSLDSRPYVYLVAPQSFLFLATPADVLYDRQIVREVRERVQRVRLDQGGGELSIERRGDGWSLTLERGGLKVLEREPADTGRVQDLLGTLEKAEILEFLPGVAMPRATGDGFWVESPDAVHGGVLGGAHTDSEGGEGRLFLREGDQLVGLVSNDVYQAVSTDPDSLRSRVLHKIEELKVARVHLKGFGAEKAYVRGAKGRWSLLGTAAEAVHFAALVDPLLAPRAVRFLQRDEGGELSDPLDVRILDGAGRAIAFRLGLATLASDDGEPAAVYESEDGHRAVVARDLYDGLAALLRGD